MKIKNMVNQRLQLLNGIAVIRPRPTAPAAKIGLNIAYSFRLGFLPGFVTLALDLAA
jgi:hypothetical protein